MKFENTYVSNFQGAFRGLRNPLESWNKSDSMFGIDDTYSTTDFYVASRYCKYNNIPLDDGEKYDEEQSKYATWLRDNGILRWSNEDLFEYAYIGPVDMDLAHRMIQAGTSDSKFLRQINVTVDITAPLYWWKQADTYKIGTTANSTSTMHKISSTPITMERFETDDYNTELKVFDNEPYNINTSIEDCWDDIINICETLRQRYLETKDQRYWKELIRILPEGWLQTRTWTANYAVLRNIYSQRRNHRLTEWKQFCDWVKTLPYANDLILYNL